MRLAVMLAMQPFANFRRAFAMSTLGVRTGTPTASIPDDFAADQLEHQPEVVNHQVEDHIDVEAALREGAQPMHLDETRLVDVRAGGQHGRVEVLDVPDGQRRTRIARPPPAGGRPPRIERVIGFSSSTWMPASSSGSATLGVRLGRHRHADGVDLANQVGHTRHHRRPRRAGDLRGSPRIGIDDADERRVGKRGQHAGMMAPEVADADDRDANRCRCAHDCPAPASADPTTAMSASSADASIVSRSNIRVLPASSDSSVAPAHRIA